MWLLSGPRSLARAYTRIARGYTARQERHWRVILSLQIGYCAVVGGGLLYTQSWPTPDIVGLFLLVFAILSGRGFTFIRDWSPFVLLILSYEALRGMAPGLVANTHIQFPIDADKALFFGNVPTIWLQQHLWDPQHLHWYDYFAAFMHPMHFLVPLALAFVLWAKNKVLYWKFVASYLLLSYAGYVTYVLFPMAPPWYASGMGALPHVESILNDVLWRHSISHPIVLAYSHFNANQVAAMPSLHAAFPVLVWLTLWHLQPKWGWLGVLYPMPVDWAVVYMGEHYVIDVIAGSMYGAAAYAAVWVLPEWIHARRSAPASVSEAETERPEVARLPVSPGPPGR